MIRFVIIGVAVLIAVAVFLVVRALLQRRATVENRRLSQEQAGNESQQRPGMSNAEIDARVAELEKRLTELNNEVFPGEEPGAQR